MRATHASVHRLVRNLGVSSLVGQCTQNRGVIGSLKLAESLTDFTAGTQIPPVRRGLVHTMTRETYRHTQTHRHTDTHTDVKFSSV